VQFEPFETNTGEHASVTFGQDKKRRNQYPTVGVTITSAFVNIFL
jgi:hypothetical protein